MTRREANLTATSASENSESPTGLLPVIRLFLQASARDSSSRCLQYFSQTGSRLKRSGLADVIHNPGTHFLRTILGAAFHLNFRCTHVSIQ